MVPTVPRHVAFIMDGNGRWAMKHGHDTRIAGHEKGAEVITDLVLAGLNMGVEYMTFYVFSTENWARPSEEVEFILSDLLPRYLELKLDFMMENSIRFRAMGRLEKLPKSALVALDKVCKATEENSRANVTLALNYGSQQDIVEGVKAFARKAIDDPTLIESLDPSGFRNYLDLPELPEPDLLVRTSGEKRLSNFMLWHLSYTEILFDEQLWPDYTPKDFKNAVEEYSRRTRRYGNSLVG